MVCVYAEYVLVSVDDSAVYVTVLVLASTVYIEWTVFMKPASAVMYGSPGTSKVGRGPGVEVQVVSQS